MSHLPRAYVPFHSSIPACRRVDRALYELLALREDLQQMALKNRELRAAQPMDYNRPVVQRVRLRFKARLRVLACSAIDQYDWRWPLPCAHLLSGTLDACCGRVSSVQALSETLWTSLEGSRSRLEPFMSFITESEKAEEVKAVRKSAVVSWLW